MSNTQTEESNNKSISYEIKDNSSNLVSNEDNSVNTENSKPQETTDFFNESPDSIKKICSSLQKSISSLQKDFETKIKYDNSKDTTIDSLHKELETYREDLAFKLLRPLVLELARIADMMRSLSAKYKENDPSSESVKFAEELDNVILDIKEAISLHGFEFFRVEDPIFDRSQQKVQAAIDTDDSKLDKHIARRIKVGVRYEEKVIRPELVTVYRYITPKIEQPEI